MRTFCGVNVIAARVNILLLTFISVNAYSMDNAELTSFAKSVTERSEQYRMQLQAGVNDTNQAQKQLLITQHMEPKFFIAISFSMPEKLILDYFKQASQYDAWIVVQGFKDNEMPKMLQMLAQWDKQVDISRLLIDPNIFKQYQVSEVPSLILTTDSYPCDSQKCIATNFDKVIGSVQLDYALKIISERGDLHQEAKAWKVKR